MSGAHSEAYERYLASPTWRRRRHAAIAAATWRCQRCGWQCRWYDGRGLEVHHRHYDTLGAEAEADLEVLCWRCHPAADREREATTAARAWAARLDGWATKVYGEDWEAYADSHWVAEQFESWLEQQPRWAGD